MPMGFKDSYFYHRWYSQVVEPPSNDFVIAISASGKSTMSRTGKTTLETLIAQECDQSDGGFDAEQKATLDAGELAYDVVPDVPNKSAVCLEEAQGAAGTTGIDARRGMKTEVIDSINAILNNGDKELTIIITAQHLPMLDKRLPPIVDAWLLIRHGPSSPNGPLGIHHGMLVEDYNFDSPKIKTPAYEDFSWPRVPESNENYKILEEKKVKAKQKYSDEDEEDSDLPDEAQREIAQEFRNMGQSARWIADNVEAITYSYSWIYDHTDAPKETNKQNEVKA
jgi:hypothetical protein